MISNEKIHALRTGLSQLKEALADDPDSVVSELPDHLKDLISDIKKVKSEISRAYHTKRRNKKRKDSFQEKMPRQIIIKPKQNQSEKTAELLNEIFKDGIS